MTPDVESTLSPETRAQIEKNRQSGAAQESEQRRFEREHELRDAKDVGLQAVNVYLRRYSRRMKAKVTRSIQREYEDAGARGLAFDPDAAAARALAAVAEEYGAPELGRLLVGGESDGDDT